MELTLWQREVIDFFLRNWFIFKEDIDRRKYENVQNNPDNYITANWFLGTEWYGCESSVEWFTFVKGYNFHNDDYRNSVRISLRLDGPTLSK